VLPRDVCLVIPPVLAYARMRMPDEQVHAGGQILIASRFFGLPFDVECDVPLLERFAVVSTLRPFDWSIALPASRQGPEATIFVVFDGTELRLGMPAIIAGWATIDDVWNLAARGQAANPEPEIPIAKLRSPESFRMANTELVRTYSQKFKHDCLIRHKLGGHHRG
jgi:hypothetical protein